MAKVTVTIETKSTTITSAEVRNAVRRAFTENVPLPVGKISVGGLNVKVKETEPETEAQRIRRIARSKGIEVGKRGRISAALREKIGA